MFHRILEVHPMVGMTGIKENAGTPLDIHPNPSVGARWFMEMTDSSVQDPKKF